jgi:hypothetical protein
VSTGLALDRAALNDPRTRNLARGDNSGESTVDSAAVTNSGESPVEGRCAGREHVCSELGYRDLTPQARCEIARSTEMNVRVDEAGRDCQPGAVQHLRPRGRRSTECTDAAIFHGNSAVLDRVGARAVDDRCTGQPYDRHIECSSDVYRSPEDSADIPNRVRLV